MNSEFNTFVRTLLEANSGGKGTSGDIINAMVELFKKSSADTGVADALEHNILKNPRYTTILHSVPDSPDRLRQLELMINDATKSFAASAHYSPSRQRSNTRGTPKYKGDLKPGYLRQTDPNTGEPIGLGARRGDYILHGPTEQAFRDVMFSWHQGNLLKKIGMLGKAARGFLSPKAQGSTGIFQQ